MSLSEIPPSRKTWTQPTADELVAFAGCSGRGEVVEGFETSMAAPEAGGALYEFSEALRAINIDTATMFSVIDNARTSLSFIGNAVGKRSNFRLLHRRLEI